MRYFSSTIITLSVLVSGFSLALPALASAATCPLPNYPDASCTGVPAGTALTVVNGNMTINTANTVVDSKDIRGCVLVTAPGVIIKNSKITCSSGYAIDYYNNGGSAAWLTVQDSTIDCVNGFTAIGEEEVNAYRNDISRCENGFDVNKNMTIQDNYLHDMYQGAEAHTDGIQMWNTATGVSIIHNRIYSNNGTSAIISPSSGTLNTLIQDNLFAGGAATLYCRQGGPGGQRVINNHFSTIFYPQVGAYGPTTECEDEAEFSGNVIHETGQTVNSDGSISSGGDTQSPSTPAGLSASAVSSSQINLSWTASTDNVGVTGYKIFRGGVQIGTSATNSYSNTGLSASTAYSYYVRATDAAGNLSGNSNTASATTQAGTPVPTATLSANPTSITSGQSSTLTWSSTNATSCTASGGWSGAKATSGTQSVSPTVTTTYSITCTGAGGTSPAANATVTVSGGTVQTASVEAESATRSGGAFVGSDSNASGGQYMQFASVQLPPPTGCPAYPAFPDASCTGVPAGTTLTVKNGNQTISTAGTVVSGWDVRGKLIINAANVTVKNSIVHGPAAGGCSNGAAIEINSDNAIIQDSEVVMDNPTACLDGIWMSGNFGTLTRVNVHGGVDGVKAGTSPSDHDYLIQDSYIHGMKWFASDPNQGGGETHNDGVQTWASVHNITLTHNRIDMSTVLDSGGNLASNAAWQDSAYNSRAEYNYLDGGGCTLNFDAQSLGGGATLQPMYVNFNHFGRIRGSNNCVVLISNKTVMTQYNGNVWQDTGLPVPTYQQHD